MVIGVTVITVSLIYSILLAIVYFSKQRITSFENKIYSRLVIINVFGLILELACSYFVYNYNTTIFNNIMCILTNRLFVIYLLTWEFIFTLYIYFVSFPTKEKQKNKVLSITLIFYILVLMLALVLPLNYFKDSTYVYSYGLATDLLVIVGIICVIIDVFCVVTNYKKNRY